MDTPIEDAASTRAQPGSQANKAGQGQAQRKEGVCFGKESRIKELAGDRYSL